MEEIIIDEKQCPYYRTGRKCANKKYCPEQAGFDDCMSYRYYAMDLEQQLKHKEKECKKYKQALQNIKTLINEDISTLSCECCTKNNDECSRCFKDVVEKVNNILSGVENE